MFYNFFFKYSPLLWVLKKKKIRNLILLAKFGVFIVLIVLTENYKIWFRRILFLEKFLLHDKSNDKVREKSTFSSLVRERSRESQSFK